MHAQAFRLVVEYIATESLDSLDTNKHEYSAHAVSDMGTTRGKSTASSVSPVLHRKIYLT